MPVSASHNSRRTAGSACVRISLLAAFAMLAHGCQESAPIVVPPPGPDPRGPWLEANVQPFAGAHLSLPHGDIEFLREIVGDARIVSLGEGTHGTRDFFEMKARILRFLVEEMGFNTFAIEATWPESRRIDHYVHTGEGDPRVFLSALYFWTWNTESVLEMIEWMREHNEAGGDIGFHGFDMQYPGMALHNVREYVRTVDPENADIVAERLDCLTRHANGPDGWRTSAESYPIQVSSYHSACGAAMEEVRDLFLANRERFAAVSGEDAFEVALQSLRVAFQYHLEAAEGQNRDMFMAENTEWISRQIGPEGKMVLWAHNNHVANRPHRQGLYLRQTFGDEMVIFGFSHETGRFSGVDLRPGGGSGYGPHDLEPPTPGSFERVFANVNFPGFFLDLRNRDFDTQETYWLGESRLFRSIGCCLSPNYGTWFNTPLAEWYDVIIHFKQTRATTILPFRYPESW